MAQLRDDDLKLRLADYNETRMPFEARQFVCQAPFVSMNFDQSGNATVCCYNRTQVLGTYPANSVSEMWNSQKIEELRQAMRETNLDKGCYNCKEQIVSGNYYSTLARNFDLLTVLGEEAARTGPRILEFETSNICNLECIMCNGHFSSLIRKNREKLPPQPNPYDDNFVTQLRPFWKTVEWAKFLGGEPFLNSIYFKIWKEIGEINPNIKVVITSNATVMNSRVEWVLANVKPLMVLSVDSLHKKTYEKIRVNATFEKTTENIYKYLAYSRATGRTVDIAVCPMIHNWEELPEMFDWGTKHIAIINPNTLTNPPELSLKSLGRKRLLEIISIYKTHKLKTWQDFTEDTFKWHKIVSNANHQKFQSLINQLQFWADELSASAESEREIEL